MTTPIRDFRSAAFWAGITAFVWFAFGAVPLQVAVAGQLGLSSLQDALEKSFSGRLRFGSLIAFVVAATPFAFAGITSAFWAIVAGFGGSMLVERRELLRYRREQ